MRRKPDWPVLLAASLERRATGFAGRFPPGADDARTPRVLDAAGMR
ncbi:MAG: hypothetical protein HOY75_31550 [Streptomyces sp.]|nr:hypothetical protein [Streptomyces sp.]